MSDIFPHSDFEKATLQTTDATATLVAGVSVAELQAVTIWVFATAAQDDATSSLSFFAMASFKRAAAGNVAINGTQWSGNTINPDAITTDITITANTTTQEAEIKCTGEAGTTYNWNVHYKIVASQ